MTPQFPSKGVFFGTGTEPAKEEELVAEELKTQCGLVVLVSVAVAVAVAVAVVVVVAKEEGVVHTGHSKGLGLESVGVSMGVGLGLGGDEAYARFSKRGAARTGQSADFFILHET